MNRFALSLGISCLLAGPMHVGLCAQTNESEAVEIEGACVYAERLAPLIDQGHVFAECDRMIRRQSDGVSELEFAYPSRLRSLVFRGSFSEDSTLTVTSMRARSWGDWRDAEGACEFNSRGNKGEPVVTCIVKSSGQFFVTNFEYEI